MYKTTTVMIGFLIILVPSSAKAQNRTRAIGQAEKSSQIIHPQPIFQPPANGEETAIVQRIRAMELQMKKAEALLQQQLARAQQIRRRALQNNDRQMFQLAERVERQAMARYEQSISRFNQFGTQLDQMTKARARSATRPATQRAPAVRQPPANQRYRNYRRPRVRNRSTNAATGRRTERKWRWAA